MPKCGDFFCLLIFKLVERRTELRYKQTGTKLAEPNNKFRISNPNPQRLRCNGMSDLEWRVSFTRERGKRKTIANCLYQRSSAGGPSLSTGISDLHNL